MTTLAEMTSEQRAEAVGLWADVVVRENDEARGIITKCGQMGTQVYIVADDARIVTTNESITPRFDLPRAWTPQGQPVAGEWEHPEGEFEDRGGMYSEYVHEPVRRFVTEWEQC